MTIKYTILYKNGKAWNGKAESILQIKPVECVLMAVHKLSGYTYLYHACNGRWEYFEELLTDAYNGPSKRTLNPKSTTKKQKAFAKAYGKWIQGELQVRADTGGLLGQDCSLKAYKKWLYEQKMYKALQTDVSKLLEGKSSFIYMNNDSNEAKFAPPPSPGDGIGYYPPGSNKMEWITVKDKDGFIPWSGGKCPVPLGTMVHVKYRNSVETICTAGYHPAERGFKNLNGEELFALDWYHDGDDDPGEIIAYKLHEEPKATTPPKITHYLPGNFMGKDIRIKISYDIPIKTTYTFWLGANGEIVDYE